MKLSALALTTLSWQALAFPAVIEYGLIGNPQDSPLQRRYTEKESHEPHKPHFSENQRVDVSGAHKWMPPKGLDERGPCPGLNAMANHAYLPRTGLATIADIIEANENVFAMGRDLASVLAVYGSSMDGYGGGWSIGGTIHTGIGGSHSNYETDNSPVRGDLNQYGTSHTVIMEQFRKLYDLQPNAETADYTLEVLREYRKIRFAQSIAENPWFYYAPFSGAVVSQAAYSFIPRFFGNKTREHPEGVLNKEILKSFYSIYGPEDNLRWVPGHERIPWNWYSRNQKDPYNVEYLESDMNYLAQGEPRILKPGCNTKGVNSYKEIQPTSDKGKNITASPLCVGFAEAVQHAQKYGVTQNLLEEYFLVAQNAAGCKTVPSMDETAAKACPGYSIYGGPTGKVAPGAIQN